MIVRTAAVWQGRRQTLSCLPVKIYISADIEGVAGIADWSEGDRTDPSWQEFRQRMTAEVSAACQAALEAGATDILVKDAHGSARNVLAEELPPPARLIRGWSGHPYRMVQELDESFDRALFIGWHAAAGCGGNPLAHSLSSKKLSALRVNGEPASEFLLHSYTAALVGVPICLVSGDEALCAGVQTFDERIITVPVMRGVGASSIALHPADARTAIAQGVERAMQTERWVPGLPDYFEVEVTYKQASAAYRSSQYPGARLMNGDTIGFSTDDWFEVMRMLIFVV